MDDKELAKLTPQEAMKQLSGEDLTRYNRLQAERLDKKSKENKERALSQRSEMERKIIQAAREESKLQGSIILDGEKFDIEIDMKKAEKVKDDLNKIYDKNRDEKIDGEIITEEEQELINETIEILSQIISSDWSHKKFWNDFVEYSGSYALQRLFLKSEKS